MESFIFMEKKQRFNKDYYLISNYSRSLVFDSSELKNKIMLGEISVSNLIINNNKLVEVANNTKFQSEKELFYFGLSDVITVNCNTDKPMKLAISKLKEINKRKTQFDNDVDTRKSCVLLLDRYFDYLGKTEFKFLGKKYNEMLESNALESMELKLNYNVLDKTLDKYIKDGTIKNWSENRKTDVYCYHQLISCLNKLYNLAYSDERQKKISAVLEILGTYFDDVKPNMCGIYLHGYYMLQISEACIKALKSHTDLQIPRISVPERKEFLKNSAGRHEEQYSFNKKQILNNSRHFNKMTKKYNKETKQILDCFKDMPPMNSSDIADLETLLKKYTKHIKEEYTAVTKTLVDLCNKHKNTDVIQVVEGLADFAGYLKFDGVEVNPFGATLGVGKAVIGASNILVHKLEECCNDKLSYEAQDLLRIYRDMSEGERATLLYVLDSSRLKLLDRQNKSIDKIKKLKLYSNFSIVPLIDSVFYRPKTVWNLNKAEGLLEKDLRDIEISWLTTYYIMYDKVNENMVYIRRNSPIISLAFFCECMRVYAPHIEKSKLNTFSGLLRVTYKWDLDIEDINDDKLTKINLLALLKEK